MPRANTTEELKFQPHARLLTMLGDQLIKNERIALMELIKNSYDADADWARVSFEGFGKKWYGKNGKIIIEDNGDGMDADVLRNAWMRPATPNKRLKKDDESTRKTEKGRVIQGEKGIGRFAVLKLGAHIRVITRPRGSKREHVLTFDFSEYDAEFLTHKKKKKELLLDNLTAKRESRTPVVFDSRKVVINSRSYEGNESGTRIEISYLKSRWTQAKVDSVCGDALKLQSVFSQLFPDHEEEKKQWFDVAFVCGGKEQEYKLAKLEKLNRLMHNNAVLKIEDGKFDNAKNEYSYQLNGKLKKLTLDDLRGDRWIKGPFGELNNPDKTTPNCGSFRFSFYVFDLKAENGGKFYLQSDEVEDIRLHRVYLYRDRVRVYPYGNPEDDWLGIDIARGTISAGAFLGNDQVIGCIDITQDGNPSLRDKTSREGLVDDDATIDFVNVIRGFLSHIRSKEFARYRADIARRRRAKALKEGKVNKTFEQLLTHLGKSGDVKAAKIAETAMRAVKVQKDVYEKRIETTEDLAAVGIAVETSSHDLMLMLERARDIIAKIHGTCCADEERYGDIKPDVEQLKGVLSFVADNMLDVQRLFASSKQRCRPTRVRDILDKVYKIHQRFLGEAKVVVDIDPQGCPLVAKCTDAVLMQLFINLFDNAVYWLRQQPEENRHIGVKLDGGDNTLIFADNGPGIHSEDVDYIFDPFYSGKGEDGRGLGLYIARQLLERLDYSIELITDRKEKILPGANFRVVFLAGDQ